MAAPTSSDVRVWAVWYVDTFRWPVLPIVPGGKKPALTRWIHLQTRFPTKEELDRDFAQEGVGLGIVCGLVSGQVVIDADSEEGCRRFEDLIPDGLRTPVCKTPRGKHWHFRHPGGRIKRKIKLLADVDFLADGSYVIAPPTEGRTWLPGLSPDEVDLADLPDPIKALISAKRTSVNRTVQPPRGKRTDRSGHTPTAYAYAAKALENESAAVRAAQEGCRNNALVRAAFNTGQLVGEGLLDRSEVEAELADAALEVGLDRVETARTLRSGLDAGAITPRPPRHSPHYESYRERTSPRGVQPPPLPKVIRSLILGGISKTEAKASLIQTVPALNPSDLASMIDLEYALVGRPKTSVASRVREFALAATAPFEATTCDRILGLETERDKRAGRKELERLVKSGRLERLKRNLYGPVNRVAEPIDWRNADTAKGLDLRFPLDLHGLFQVIPSSLVVVAGTLGSEVIYFCLNLIHLNQDKFDIHLITDSAVANPIALRKAMDQFGFPVETWRFSAERPGGEIHKSIKSSALNIVLFPQSSGRPGDEYYLTGPRIADIQKALGSGTAVVGLLKNPEKEIGRGGWPTIAPATVAVNLDASLDAEHPSKLTIVEARFPLADGVRGRVMRYRVGRNGVFTKASQSRGAYERE